MTTVHLDDDLIAVLPKNGEPLDRMARELIVVELYRRDAISGGKAAELLGMSRLEFIRFSGRLGIPYGNMSAEDWDAELRTIGERPSP
jgi:predicted HTH domain antitoxin